jgi:hypothetical protein
MSTIVEPKVIKIKKVKRIGFFGIDSYGNSQTIIGAEVSKKGHNTGLTKEDEAYFEAELKLPKGTLAPHSAWWDEVFNTQHVLRLKNSKTNELILDNPINELRYKVLLASSKIANSEVEKSKPYVEFYIDDEEAKAKKELETFNFEFEGMKIIFKMTPEEKRGSLKLFGKKGTDLMSESVVDMQLVRELKEAPKQFFEIMTDKDLKTKTFIKELEEYGIINRKNNTYNYGDDTLAITTDEAVLYFNDLKNQSVVLTLGQKLKKVKKEKEG